MARLVKAGTPHHPAAGGEYTPEEQLWLAAAAEAGKRAMARRNLPRPQMPAAPAAQTVAPAGTPCRARAAAPGIPGPGRPPRRKALPHGRSLPGSISRALAQRPAVVHGGGVLLPVAFPQTGLHVLRAGVFVGSVQKGRFVPEHHLFTAFGSLCTNCEQLTLADCRCTEYLSGRGVEARTAADSGWCCVTVDGWPLGGGKVSGGRVKNHYPKALRLL